MTSNLVPSAAAALLLLLLLAALHLRSRRLAREAAERERLAGSRQAELRRQFTLESFDVLWLATVTADAETRRILKVHPGLPHCRKCRAPLAARPGGWVCSKCGDLKPESLADLRVTDSVTREVLRAFREQNPGYELA